MATTFEDRVSFYATHDVISLRRELLALRGVKKLLLKVGKDGWGKFHAAFLDIEARIERCCSDGVKISDDLQGMVDKALLGPVISIINDVLAGFDIDREQVMREINEAYARIGLTERELSDQVYLSEILDKASDSQDLATEIGELRAMLEDIIGDLRDVDDLKENYKLILNFADRLILTIGKCHRLRLKSKLVVERVSMLGVVFRMGDIITEALSGLIDNPEMFEERPRRGKLTMSGYQNRAYIQTVDTIRAEVLRRVGMQLDGMSEEEIDRWLHGHAVICEVTFPFDWNFRYFGTPFADRDDLYAMMLSSMIEGVKGFKARHKRLSGGKWTPEDLQRGCDYVRQKQGEGVVWGNNRWQPLAELVSVQGRRFQLEADA